MRIINKNFQVEELLSELFLTTRQKNKIRNAFANNMSTDIKLSNTQISKIFQSGGFFCGMLSSLGNIGKELGKKAKADFAFLLAKDVLPALVSNMASNVT